MIVPLPLEHAARDRRLARDRLIRGPSGRLLCLQSWYMPLCAHATQSRCVRYFLVTVVGSSWDLIEAVQF